MEEQILHRLASALRGLARAPSPCFCEHGIGNPMVSDHSQACQEARAALTEADEYLQSSQCPGGTPAAEQGDNP